MPSAPVTAQQANASGWGNSSAENKSFATQSAWPPAATASAFPKPSSLQKHAPVELIQDENGWITEAPPPTPVQAPVAQRPINQQQPQTLTPTQHKLLMNKNSSVVSKVTAKKLAELNKQTGPSYMDDVVANFRQSQQQQLNQQCSGQGT
jgi:hypothetical protein